MLACRASRRHGLLALGPAGCSASLSGSTRGRRAAVAALVHDTHRLMDDMSLRDGGCRLRRKIERHVQLSVQLPAEVAIHTVEGRAQPLMVGRQKEEGFAACVAIYGSQ